MSLKSAKALSGTIYSYAVDTAGEFLQQLSIEKDIPTYLLCMFDSEKQLSRDAILSDDEMYSLFVKEGGKLCAWIDKGKLSPFALAKLPSAVPMMEEDGVTELQVMNMMTNPKALHLLEQFPRLLLSNTCLFNLCSNPNPDSLRIIQQYQGKIYWPLMSRNAGAISFLEQNLHKVSLTELCLNPNLFTMGSDGLEWLTTQLDKRPECWYNLSCNPAAVEFLAQNLDKVNWYNLSRNAAAIELLEQNPDKIDWNNLCENPAAIHLIEQNLDKVNWYNLSRNPAAIELLEQNLDKVNWNNLSRNPAAIELLKQNPDKICWELLSENPAIFETCGEL